MQPNSVIFVHENHRPMYVVHVKNRVSRLYDVSLTFERPIENNVKLVIITSNRITRIMMTLNPK